MQFDHSIDTVVKPSLYPQSSITGVESTEGIDYLRLTRAPRDIERPERRRLDGEKIEGQKDPYVTDGHCFIDLLGIPLEKWEELPYGGKWYNRSRVYGPLKIYYDPSTEANGSMLEMKGDGCRLVEQRERAQDPAWTWEKFCAMAYYTYGCKCTRLDIYRDDRAGVLDIDAIIGLLDQRAYIGHSDEIDPHTRRRNRAPWAGQYAGRKEHAVCIGSRKTERYMRVYDKRLEEHQKEWGPDRAEKLNVYGHHIRVELEMKDKVANKVLEKIADGGLTPALISGLLRGFIDLKNEPLEGVRNKHRVATPYQPWETFLMTENKEEIKLPIKKSNMDEKRGHFNKQWAAFLATTMVLDGGDMQWIKEVLKEGHTRMKAKHYQMIDIEEERRLHLLHEIQYLPTVLFGAVARRPDGVEVVI